MGKIDLHIEKTKLIPNVSGPSKLLVNCCDFDVYWQFLPRDLNPTNMEI